MCVRRTNAVISREGKGRLACGTGTAPALELEFYPFCSASTRLHCNLVKTREITSSLADATGRRNAQHRHAPPGGDERTASASCAQIRPPRCTSAASRAKFFQQTPFRFSFSAWRHRNLCQSSQWMPRPVLSPVPRSVDGTALRRPGAIRRRLSNRKLSVGRSYQVYAEPRNGAGDPPQIRIAALCRNATTDSGWPP